MVCMRAGPEMDPEPRVVPGSQQAHKAYPPSFFFFPVVESPWYLQGRELLHH